MTPEEMERHNLKLGHERMFKALEALAGMKLAHDAREVIAEGLGVNYPKFCSHPVRCARAGRCDRKLHGEPWCCAD